MHCNYDLEYFLKITRFRKIQKIKGQHMIAISYQPNLTKDLINGQRKEWKLAGVLKMLKEIIIQGCMIFFFLYLKDYHKKKSRSKSKPKLIRINVWKISVNTDSQSVFSVEKLSHMRPQKAQLNRKMEEMDRIQDSNVNGN